MRTPILLLASPLLMLLAGASSDRWDAPHSLNPLLPGYFADPAFVEEDGTYYIFATIDPWGGERLGLWTSKDGRNWRFSTPEWPTKAAATSATSSKSMVWAPSVVKAQGKWWMYVSVGSEVWVGTAPSPDGPWRDANGGKPLIPGNYRPGYHIIDAEAFVDDDGQAYLAWGSGLNWVNGRCFIVKLKPDMVTFDGEPRDVTPTNYFEAPFLFKQGGTYYLTYSDGNTTKDTYKVRYATGPTPMGPFKEAANSPILQTDAVKGVISPGHHAMFRSGGETYILYHRQALPFPRASDDVLRQVAVDRLRFSRSGAIERVAPTHGALVKGFAGHRAMGEPIKVTGDGEAAHPAAHAADDNYATLWRAAGDRPSITADLGRVMQVRQSELRPEFPSRPYRVAVELSADGQRWTKAGAVQEVSGSPITLRHAGQARYVRLTFGGKAGLWEWAID